jgi:transcription initiation factor IIE alpha subunit
MSSEHEPELLNCAECSRMFDLAAQDYYGPRCPQCTETLEESDSEMEKDVDENKELYEAMADEDPTCAGKDGDCSRSVDEPGDYCWQHP